LFRSMTLVLDALIYVVAWTHVLLAPYTKVEESFNLHAIHDFLFYGVHHEMIPKVTYALQSRIIS
jgi:alpha-1,6-mannosyltransferase